MKEYLDLQLVVKLLHIARIGEEKSTLLGYYTLLAYARWSLTTTVVNNVSFTHIMGCFYAV